MKKILTLLTLFLAAATADAGNDFASKLLDRLEIGLEWGYTGTFYEHAHFNYLSEEGSRVDSMYDRFQYYSNGELLCHAGVAICPKLTVGATLGWAGVDEGRRGIPITARVAWFPAGSRQDGVKLFADAGIFQASRYKDMTSYIARIGSGYRWMLSEHISIDSFLQLQGALDHPRYVYDRANNYLPDYADLRRSDTSSIGLTVGLALNF